MAANLTARQLRVFIGSDDQEWSFAAAVFLPEQESFGESGLIKTFAQVTLLDVLGNPESLDPRANPSRWREGQVVRVDVATDTGEWLTWGNLRLLGIPSGPTNGRLTLQLGCWLAWADDPQPEGDRSEVETGVGENSADVATRLLVASGIPEAAIDLGAWDYDLPYPLQKEGNGSYIAQAGALAFANHCRQLYQDPDGIIRAAQWSNTPGTPAATVTVGLNESLFEPTPDPVPPVERVVVSGVGYQVTETPNRYSSSFTVTEPASNFSDDAIGTVGITTTEIYEWGEPDESHDYYWTRSETRLRQPQAATWIGSDSTQPSTTTTYEERRYDATTKILYRIETGEIANVRTLVDSTVTAAGVTIVQRTIANLEHDGALETLTRRTETTTVPRITLTGDTGSTGRFVQETSRILNTQWTEDKPDYWVERTSERVAAKNGSGRQGNIKPTALITQRPQIKPDSRPPATERWQDPTGLKEQHYTATCTWQHPGGATGRVRTRSLTVDPGFSNQQCFEIATREVQLLEGRRESHLIELPLSDALLWLPPLSTIQVDDGTNLWTFKLDATTWEYALQEARLVAMGIAVARVAVEAPVGTPLPEFESGVDPGQVAPEEPPEFVPPADEVRDIEVTARARRGRAAVVADSPSALTVRSSARRGRAVAAVAVEDAAVIRARARRGRAVAAVEVPALVAIAATARRGRAVVAISESLADVYLRPDGTSQYLRPDSTSTYERPE